METSRRRRRREIRPTIGVGTDITLPNQMADALRERVQSGEYASESEVIRDGLRALFAQEAAVEAWLRHEVAAAYDAAKAAPGSAVTADEIRQRLAARRSAS